MFYIFRRVFERLAQLIEICLLGTEATPPLPSAACCNAVFHKCPLNDFCDTTGMCGVAYLARTVNNS